MIADTFYREEKQDKWEITVHYEGRDFKFSSGASISGHSAGLLALGQAINDFCSGRGTEGWAWLSYEGDAEATCRRLKEEHRRYEDGILRQAEKIKVKRAAEQA